MVTSSAMICEHCLLPVTDREAVYDDLPSGRKVFCCRACNAIYRMITEEGLHDFYKKRDWKTAGIPESLQCADDGHGEAAGAEPEALAPFIHDDEYIKEADLMVDGIRCASCIWLNEKVLERTVGVVSARFNFATHRAVVRWDSTKTNLGKIISRIRSVGYLARPYLPAAHEESLKKQNRDLLMRFGAAAFFSMQLMTVSSGLYAGFFQGIDPVAKSWLQAAAFLVCTPVLFYSGRPILLGAFRGIKNRVLNMDALISLGALSAYLLSIRHLFNGGEVYFDTAAMIITLVLLGRLLENSAKQKTSQAVSRLMMLQPQEARVVRGDERILMLVHEVNRGDLVEVRPGEKIPLDGIVRNGVSEADESLVTGESRPVEKILGAEVIGGSVNGLGTITMEVTRVGQETVLAQIARLVENALAKAAPIQRVADRVSAWFIPFVVSAAAATYFFWSRQETGSAPVLNAVSVLVIACPCALGLATPVAILAGAGRAARKGILIKGGDILERMHKVNTVVLDKTGTITTGRLQVIEVKGPGSRGQGPGGEQAILQYAASAEQGSEHILGAAIVSYAKKQGIELYKIDSCTAVPGQGVKARVNNTSVFVGKRNFLEQEGVSLSPELIAEAENMEQNGRTVVWVSLDKELLGVIALLDAPRPDASSAIEQLQRMNIDVIMITGDNRNTAQAVAAKTGIRSIRAAVMPAHKSDAIAELRAKGRVTAMVGDGINDAPALASSDVGIAMSSGSDIAMESADVVLLKPDLSSVVEALELSRKTFSIIKQNLFWAFSYNFAAIPLAMAGVLSPIVAAGAMAMSSVTVVMNSLRIR